jgi:enamine deaminase RidA (YjgF/YER057c/UK114 family)
VSAAKALAEAGLVLPAPNRPVANYVMARRDGKHLVLSGHGAFEDGKPTHLGRLGEDLTTEQGRAAAEAVMLNMLATVDAELGGLDEVERFLKLTVFVSSTPAFAEQHLVADGATDLLVRLYGDRGKPARAAVGVAALPLGFAVEIEALVAAR